MLKTEVAALNKTVQETHEWLSELADSTSLTDEAGAYTALRAVLHSLRDRLNVDEAVHLSAQLPMLVRGFYFEGWDPSLAPNQEETLEEFLASIEESLRNARFTIDTERATRDIFTFLSQKLSPGQVRHVKSQLPRELESLWPA